MAEATKEIAAEGSAVKYRVAASLAEAGGRLDAFLAKAVPALSRSRLKRLIEEGRVLSAEGPALDPAAKVRAGQTFAILVPESADPRPAAQAVPLEILHEDQHLIVIDKPAGLVVHPAPGNPDRTLVNALIAHCGASLAGIGGVKRPGIVHRLDKDTSGLMVVAKTEAAYAGLQRQFAARSVTRAYHALVWSVPRPRHGEIEANIGRSRRDRKKMAVVRSGGKAALTRYRVLADYGGVASLLECRLATGRTHQIRVHLASIGHPVMGDPVYGRAATRRKASLPPRARAALDDLGRQALDAYLLGFEHPVSAEPLQFSRTFPRDFKNLMISLEEI
jgi:23S rRNA pseudouridine1911/1915/1917 synthase